jgi:hypothetical protein
MRACAASTPTQTHTHTYIHTYDYMCAGREVLGNDFSALLIHINNFSHEWAEWGSTPSVSSDLEVPFRAKNGKVLTYTQRLFLTCCMQPSKVMCIYVCIYVRIYVCVNVCMYVCMYVCMQRLFRVRLVGVAVLKCVCLCIYVYVCMQLFMPGLN